MDIRNFISNLGFTPKDGTTNIYHKVYDCCDNYVINVDFNTKTILYGDKIQTENKSSQNFSKPENFVVLECVNRLIHKGYKPENIVLEKTWASGHGTSGRLDICVTKDDGTPYLLIECKTAGKEFDKELAKIRKDGGQIFTYFQLSGHKADVLMLYATDTEDYRENYCNEIIKVEDEYRNGEVKDIYEKWNKLTKDNGIFDAWVTPYNFQNKAITKDQLKEITSEDSSFIFNRFLEILRHNVVSDKGNAFNKIFNLFLCKVYDEKTTNDGDELKFQWIEGQDNYIGFLLRLMDLYSKGMKRFLNCTISDFDKDDFDKRCSYLDDNIKQYLLNEVRKLRLEKNNEFAIKEVYDKSSFEENAKVVKEVVELIQGYRIRYNRRQQYLSDFFELLLTTGLKQEAGQFFTPVPVAQFIIRSLPIETIVKEKLLHEDREILPYMIDYAAGSGHFITEYMHEVQNIIDKCDATKYISDTKEEIEKWKTYHFDWAPEYVYGIEKDYRLVKVGKVGCYLHGDGLANVLLSDGLANFYKNKEYRGKLRKDNDDGQKDNQQFDVLLSNPPYSVSAFRQTTRNYYTEKDFELYASLTDNSSEIECLFIERAKHLLKEHGVAGIILPSSILSNAGIYAKTREIILQYFEIVAITEFGSNTFMATGTNTVVLFLRRRDNYFAENTRKKVKMFFRSRNDVTINNIETPVAKYVEHVWKGLCYDDYITLLQKKPNENVQKHEIFADYQRKISAANEARLLEIILEREYEKMCYYLFVYGQQVVVVKSGEKDAEKQFLGYEFSSRRGNEGIHAIRRGKAIDECTLLFDTKRYDNPDRASTYIHQAFNGDFTMPIADSMKQHVFRIPIFELLTFDKADFDKALSTSVKKKVIFEKIWGNSHLVPLGEIAEIRKGTSITKEQTVPGDIPVIAGGRDVAYHHNVSNREGNIITISASGAYSGYANYFTEPIFASDCNTIRSKNETVISTKLIYELLKSIQDIIYGLQRGQAQPHVYGEDLAKIKIPIPIFDTKNQIIADTKSLESTARTTADDIRLHHAQIENILVGIQGEMLPLAVVSPYVTTVVKTDETEIENYITPENMLQNRMGIAPFNGTANTNSATRYEKDDILISNIRPYLKKIWYADRSGDCSKDVLVMRSSDNSKFLPKYIYYILCRDDFFSYVMEKKKGTKMDKDEILKYEIPVPSISEQKEIVKSIDNIYVQLTELYKLI